MATSLENQYIDESYQKVVQISGSVIADGTGSVITDLDLTASNAVSASYAVSASVEIIKEVSSSYADVAGIADAVSGSNVVGTVALATSASHALVSDTSISASHAVNSDSAISSSHAITASYAATSEPQVSSSYAISASHAEQSDNAASADSAVSVDMTTMPGDSQAFIPISLNRTGDNQTLHGDINLKYNSNSATLEPYNLTAGNIVSASSFKGDGSQVTGVISSSYAVTASHLTGAVTSASYAESASHADSSNSSLTATSASYSVTASYAESSEPQVSSSYAVSSSHAEKADSADSSTTSISASHALQADSSLTANSATTATSASHAVQADSSLTATSASHALASDTSISSSHALNADNSISSSYAITASYAENSAPQVSASYAVSSSYSVTASHSETSDLAQDANDLLIGVKNTLGVTINKGETLHAVGVTGENVDVITASNANGDMPAIGLALEDINAGAAGNAIISGKLVGFSTLGFTAGENVYVGIDGAVTATKPTGSALIQNIGIVGKVDGTDGELVVLGAGRSNDVPNIPDREVWIGNVNGVATPTDIITLTGDTGSYATTGSNVFIGNQTITGSINQSGGNVDINGSSLVSINSAGPILMEAPGFGITGNINQTGLLTSNFDAPGTNQQKAFFNIASSSIGSLDYNRVFYGMADFPGFGRFYEDYFAIEYFDSTGYNYGAELSLNGQAVGFLQKPSGSVATGRSELKLKDNLNSTGTLDMLSDNINGVGRSLVQFSNTSGNVVQLNGTNFTLIAQGGSGTVFVNGSVEVNKVMQLNEQNPLPGGETGQLAVSASNLYYHNGTAWSQIN